MLRPAFTKKFGKDAKRSQKRGKPIKKLKDVMKALIQGKKLDPRFHDHQLKGEYTDCRECHIEPDWLLIYIVDKETITFVRTGSHSDLFK